MLSEVERREDGGATEREFVKRVVGSKSTTS